MAGKTILFDIKLHEVQEIDISKMTEAQIEQISGEKMGMKAFRAQIKTTITQNKSSEIEKNKKIRGRGAAGESNMTIYS